MTKKMQKAKNWQDKARSIQERVRSIFWERAFTDVEFLVGTKFKRTIMANKVILASGSAVFATMFFGSLPEKNFPIVIPDIEPDAFYSMLEFLYLDSSPRLNEMCLLEVYYAADKYMIPSLKNLCVDRLLNMRANHEVTCFMFEKANFYDIGPLKELYKRYFRENTKAILTSSRFLESHEISIETILQQPSVSGTSEIELLRALINWTKHSSDRMTSFFHLVRYICFANLEVQDWINLNSISQKNFSNGDMLLVYEFLTDRDFRGVPEWCNISGTREYN